MRVLLVTRSLDAGGAERQLVELAKGLAARGHDAPVATMYGGGDLEAELRLAGVEVVDLGKSSRWHLLRPVWRLLREVRRARPDVVYAFRASASLLATQLRLFSPSVPIVWGIRGSKTQAEIGRYGVFERLTFWLTRFAARSAHLLIANSEAGRRQHVRVGYPEDRTLVIRNGIDTERFRPDPQLRAGQRARWEVADVELLVGRVGRLDPMKDHRTFLRAAATVAADFSDVRFAIVGGGTADVQLSLEEDARGLGIFERILWLGHRTEMPPVYNALDVMCSSSAFGEGFPNVIGEAMACGVPCVVTDVGSSGEVVGDAGVVVPAGAPDALAAGLTRMLRDVMADRSSCSRAARQRVIDEFATDRMVSRTEAALAGLVDRRERTTP